MEVLRPRVDVEGFFRDLASAPERALLLDYDGTLAPFRVRRERARPFPGVREALGGLMAEGHTRVAVISGRPAREVLSLLGLDSPPEVWGCHGWERRRADGVHEVGQVGARALRGLAEARRWAVEAGFGDRAEPKPGCLALHERGLGAGASRELRRAALAALLPLAREAGLELHEFDGGVELRAPGRDKGYAVRAILGEMSPEAAVAYLGDDLTDEEAFRAVRGRGVAVLVRPEPRPTAADLWIRPPGELLEFLARWRECARR